MFEKGDSVVIPSPDKHILPEEKIAAPYLYVSQGKDA